MKAQKVVSVILALTLMMSMVPAAFAVELENPNDIFSEEYFAYVAKEDGNPYAKKITGLMDSWRSAGYHQFGRIKITRPGQSL